MSDNMDKMAGIFLDEANDLLDKLEDYLLELEHNPTDNETISAVFRSMHTIKGSAGMFGFDEVSHFTHEAETAFDEVRNGRVAVTSELITLTLKTRDHIRAMLQSDITPELEAESTQLIHEFQNYTANNSIIKQQKETTDTVSVSPKKSEEKQQTIVNEKNTRITKQTTIEKEETLTEVTWRISFEPAESVFINGTRPLALLSELVDMGTTSIIPYFGSIPSLENIDPCRCYMSWDIILTTTRPLNEIKDVFIFLDSSSRIIIRKLAESDSDTAIIPKKLGEILVDKNVVSQDEIDRALGNQKPIGTILTEKKIVSQEDIQAALAEQTHLRQQNEKKNQVQNAQTIKVNSEKLDKLIDLVGELVTFNARLTQIADKEHNTVLSTISEQGERLILELRDITMDMRMLPIGTIFSRFRRLVRDLASETGKDIELITEGAETELDKTVIEKLNDPLVHLIRNSVDHGIELPSIRTQNGKPTQGIVTLQAQHAGAFVLITIEDDGAGLDIDKIRQKAIEKGLISPEEELTHQEIADLIFMPGFSTANKVTSISGRGVGMDVVKRDITSLGGTVSTIFTPHKGTKFTLKLPLTLAIIEGILIQIGSDFYVLPLSNVVECLEFESSVIKEGNYCASMKIRDEMTPFIDLRLFFKTEPSEETAQIIIVSDQDSRIGLVIDKVIGNYQTVIKPLGRLYQNVPFFSGATILGDGSVALILDIYKLSEIIRNNDTNA